MIKDYTSPVEQAWQGALRPATPGECRICAVPRTEQGRRITEDNANGDLIVLHAF
jgi:hypothetical protein